MKIISLLLWTMLAVLGPFAVHAQGLTVPNCTDIVGQHLNYTLSTNVFSCGTSSTGVAASAASPNGRLTLVSHTPVLFTPGLNVDGQSYVSSTIYYDCYVGQGVPYYDGSSDKSDSIPSCEVSTTMATSSTGVTNNAGVFDLFWNSTNHNICVATNGSGGGWASDTATDATRTGNTHTNTTIDNLSTNVVAAGWWPGMAITDGSGDIPGGTTIFSIGANGTSLTLSQAATGSHTGDTLTVTGATNGLRGFGYSEVHNTRGYYTNQNAVAHCYNGATDYGSIGADQATYLGTLYTTAAGQTTINFQNSGSGGPAIAIIGLWNAYNKVNMQTSEGETDVSWSVTSSTYAALNSSTKNRVQWVDGLAQSRPFVATNCSGTNSSNSGLRIADGIDWVSGPPTGNSAGGAVTGRTIYQTVAWHDARLGYHYVQYLQTNAAGLGTVTLFGDGGFCGGGVNLMM